MNAESARRGTWSRVLFLFVVRVVMASLIRVGWMQVWRANEAASFGQNEILAPISFCLVMIWLLISIFQKVYCINMQLTVYRNDFSVDLPSTPTPSSQYVSLLGVVTLTGARRRKPELRCVSPSTPVLFVSFFCWFVGRITQKLLYWISTRPGQRIGLRTFGADSDKWTDWGFFFFISLSLLLDFGRCLPFRFVKF